MRKYLDFYNEQLSSGRSGYDTIAEYKAEPIVLLPDNTHDEIDHVDLDPVLAGLNYQTASQVDSNITASLNGLFKAASFDNVSRVFTLTKYDDSIVSLPIPQTDLTTVNNTLSTLRTNQDGLFKSVTISATVYVAVLWGILAHYTQILHPNTTP